MCRIVMAILGVLAWASCLPGREGDRVQRGFRLRVGRVLPAHGVDAGRDRHQQRSEGALRRDPSRSRPSQDGLNTLNVAQPFVLMPDVSLPILPGDEIRLRRRRLRAGHPRMPAAGRCWRHSRTMWDFSPQNRLLRAVHEQDLLIGLIGPGQFGLMRLPKETACMSGRGQGQVYLGAKLARAMPWDWTGYVSLDLLVLCDPDWSLFKPQQVQGDLRVDLQRRHRAADPRTPSAARRIVP